MARRSPTERAVAGWRCGGCRRVATGTRTFWRRLGRAMRSSSPRRSPTRDSSPHRLRRDGVTRRAGLGAGRATVAGARAAAWAPVPDLAAIVVVDEHDEGHKEERAPAWHARDVAIERARRAGVPCVLLSPCPSLEALALGRSGDAVHVRGARRVADRRRGRPPPGGPAGWPVQRAARAAPARAGARAGRVRAEPHRPVPTAGVHGMRRARRLRALRRRGHPTGARPAALSPVRDRAAGDLPPLRRRAHEEPPRRREPRPGGARGARRRAGGRTAGRSAGHGGYGSRAAPGDRRRGCRRVPRLRPGTAGAALSRGGAGVRIVGSRRPDPGRPRRRWPARGPDPPAEARGRGCGVARRSRPAREGRTRHPSQPPLPAVRRDRRGVRARRPGVRRGVRRAAGGRRARPGRRPVAPPGGRPPDPLRRAGCDLPSPGPRRASRSTRCGSSSRSTGRYGPRRSPRRGRCA